jgi:hypothetical protein
MGLFVTYIYIYIYIYSCKTGVFDILFFPNSIQNVSTLNLSRGYEMSVIRIFNFLQLLCTTNILE